MKYIFFFFSFFLSLTVGAQDYTSTWEGMFSYHNVSTLTQGNNKIYAAAENAIIEFDMATYQTQTISSIQGLVADKITAIAFAPENNSLIIGYQNGLIDVYNIATKKVFTIIDIVEKQSISPSNKKINKLYIKQDKLFITTNYGISVFDISRLEFGDTYFIGPNGSQIKVLDICVFDGSIYAISQENGVYKATEDAPNLIDYNQWQQISATNNKNIFVFDNQLYAISQTNALVKYTAGNFVMQRQFSNEVTSVQPDANFLTLSFANKVILINTQLNNQLEITNFPGLPPNVSSAIHRNGQIFIGDYNTGLHKTLFNTPNSFSDLTPNSPLYNDIFDVEVSPGHVWLTYGAYSLSYEPINHARGVSHYFDNYWTNIPFDDLGKTRTLVKTTINPANPNHVFIDSFHQGLIELENHTLVNAYNTPFNPLPSLLDPQYPDYRSVRVNSGYFDAQNNFWFTLTRVKKGLYKLSPSGSFTGYDMSDIMPGLEDTNGGFSDLVPDTSGNLYFGSKSGGVIAFNPRTKQFGRLAGGEGAAELPSDNVLSLAMDNNNQLWIGTLYGLRVLYGAGQLFTNANVKANAIIFEDEEGVAQELMAGLSIFAITVDGNNNKWIATEVGAFQVSANGQKLLKHFTKSNSPLPTNTIVDIDIDPITGMVYFATAKGLVAYRGSATASAQSLANVRAFPNPVRPNYEGLVTIDGLMEGANVKITDIEGNLVYEETSPGGSIQWDTRAFGKHKVASGVYMVLITSEDQMETKVTKIMVIR